MGQFRLKLTAILASASLILAGCTAGTATSGSSSVGTNIFGQVFSSGGSVTSKVTSKATRQKISALGNVSSLVAGCDVVARSLDDNSVVATGTSNSSGEYVLTGDNLESGETYKITATCGSDVMSSVASADAVDPSSKEPVITNPRSTIIAAQIVQAILLAVETAVGAIGDPAVQELVKASILKTVQSLASSIEKTIDEAITSGAMTEPSLAEATQIGTDLDSATTATDVTNSISTNYEATHEIPATVSGAVQGAAAATSALPGCDNTLPVTVASATLCTAAVTKLMFNVLGFPVLVLKTGSLSSTISGNCNNLSTVFKNATIVDGASSGDIPDAYCYVKSNLGKIDRNRGEEKGGGDDEGPVFAETGDMTNAASSDVGVLSVLGAKIFAGTNYHIGDLDKIVFSRVDDGGDPFNGAGMNARLIANVPAPNGVKTFYYYNSSSWVNTGWLNTCDQNHDSSGNTDPCPMWDLNFDFGGADWSSAANNTALATAIGAGSNVGLNVFLAKFGGQVPSLDSLDSFLSEGRIHIDHNPSGQKEFWVMFKEHADMNGGAGESPCNDNDPETPCLGVSGASEPALRLNLTLGSIQSDKISRITDVQESVSGKYFVMPIWNKGAFSGAFSFITIENGVRMTDQLMHERALYLVTDLAQCDGASLPSAGVGTCQVGYLFNAQLDWSSCSNPSNPCPGISIVDDNLAAPVEDGSNNPKQVNVDYDYNQNWQLFFDAGKMGGHALLTKYSESGPQKLAVVVNPVDDVIQAVSLSEANALVYNVAAHYNCPAMSACTVDGFYLVKSDGTVYTRAGSSNTWSASAVCVPGSSGPDCSVSNVVKYDASSTATYGFASAGYNSLDFDANGANGSNTSFLSTYRQFRFATGPIANPNFRCSAEPFYIDKNASGSHELTCNSNDRGAASGFVTFSSDWEYQRWLNDQSPQALAENRSQYVLRYHDNGFAFSDPVGTKKLLTTAFNGWFDGNHSITSTSDLNALQLFALMFLFFEEGSDGQHPIGNLSGLPSGASDKFGVETPIFSGAAGSLIEMNKSIAHGFNKFHQD